MALVVRPKNRKIIWILVLILAIILLAIGIMSVITIFSEPIS